MAYEIICTCILFTGPMYFYHVLVILNTSEQTRNHCPGPLAYVTPIKAHRALFERTTSFYKCLATDDYHRAPSKQSVLLIGEGL
jgi:hypothetical protein